MSLRSRLSRLLQKQGRSVLKKSVHSVAVIGAPFSKGQKRRGVEHGPAAVREAGLLKRLSNLEILLLGKYSKEVTDKKKEALCTTERLWQHFLW